MRTFLLCCIAGLSTACAGQYKASQKHDWFVGQGTKLDDCGAASAAMAVNWSGGQSNLQLARASTRDSGWWSHDHIQSHLTQQGIHSSIQPAKRLAASLRNGHGALVRITVLGVPHHVFISHVDKDRQQVMIADPFHGQRRVSLRQAQQMLIDDHILVVHRQNFDYMQLPWFRSQRVI